MDKRCAGTQRLDFFFHWSNWFGETDTIPIRLNDEISENEREKNKPRTKGEYKTQQTNLNISLRQIKSFNTKNILFD